MTGGDDPFDPFGQNERTIIRPNPGGRAPAPQGPGAAPGPGAGLGAGLGAGPQQGPALRPSPGGRAVAGPAGAGAIPGGEGLVRTGAPPAALITPGANPLLAAAGPLLDLLGRLRNALTGASFTDLKASVARALDGFESDAAALGAQATDLRVAKYTLAATADDIVQNLPGEDRHVWTQDPMLGRYFGERIGGTRFFEHLDQLMRNPGAHYDLLELKHACLALGFEGMHRTSPQGQSALQTIRRDVYQALRGVRGGGGWALSPEWQGTDLGRRSLGMQVPFWAVLAVVALLLGGLFVSLRALLADDAAQVSAEVLALHPTGDIQVQRDAYAAPPPPPPPPPAPVDTGQLDRIRTALRPEIEAGQITADYLDANFIIVRLPNEVLFASGKADVTPAFRQGLAPRIGEVLANEVQILAAKGMSHGRVVALGHSDAQPLSPTSRWGSNLELSKARAQSVLQAVQLHAPSQIEMLSDGRGADDPICLPAEDPGCWPKNRRVELLIERTQ